MVVFGAVVWLAMMATTAVAECTYGIDPWPSFREAVKTAKTVVVGEVVESLGNNPPELAIRYRIRVDEILRGQSPELISFERLQPGGELRCPENSYLRVTIGDVVAIASKGELPTVENGYGYDTDKPSPFVAVVYIQGEPALNYMPHMRTMTLAQVRALVLPETDAEAAPVRAEPRRIPDLLALSLALGAAGAAAVALERRRTAISSNVR
jgi:hypothetical protein